MPRRRRPVGLRFTFLCNGTTKRHAAPRDFLPHCRLHCFGSAGEVVAGADSGLCRHFSENEYGSPFGLPFFLPGIQGGRRCATWKMAMSQFPAAISCRNGRDAQPHARDPRVARPFRGHGGVPLSRSYKGAVCPVSLTRANKTKGRYRSGVHATGRVRRAHRLWLRALGAHCLDGFETPTITGS